MGGLNQRLRKLRNLFNDVGSLDAYETQIVISGLLRNIDFDTTSCNTAACYGHLHLANAELFQSDEWKNDRLFHRSPDDNEDDNGS